jgi:hypothetical protein
MVAEEAQVVLMVSLVLAAAAAEMAKMVLATHRL